MTNGSRFPGYDVLRKRHTPSWNQKTREVVDERLAVSRDPQFLDAHEFATLQAIAARIVPQPADRPPIPVASLIDNKLLRDQEDGFRAQAMPRARAAWKRGLAALDAEARDRHGQNFVALDATQQDDLLRAMEKGELKHAAWDGMPPKTFWKQRVSKDVVFAYYSHPTAWSEMGFGGPASPRGYVRLGYDDRDPWEAAEAPPTTTTREREAAIRKNHRVG